MVIFFLFSENWFWYFSYKYEFLKNEFDSIYKMGEKPGSIQSDKMLKFLEDFIDLRHCSNLYIDSYSRSGSIKG